MMLSILIPTYNRPQDLVCAIKSCLDFSKGEVEIIVGDDSTESNLGLINEVELPANYTLHYFQRQTPLKQNKNVADLLNRATGKYSLILHDDDYLLSGALNSLINKAENNNIGSCIYFGKQQMINEKKQPISNNKLNEDYHRIADLSGIQVNPIKMSLLQQVPSNGFLFPTKIAQQIGYRAYEEVGDACDFDFIVRLVILGKCSLFFLFEDISAYTLSTHSVSRSKNYNSIYYKYKIIKEMEINLYYPDIYTDLLNKDIKILCGYYILHKHKKELNKLYFSRYYPLNKRFSLRGLYHLMRCLF